MCKKPETQGQCSYGPRVWELMSINKSSIKESINMRKLFKKAKGSSVKVLKKVPDAVLATSFLLGLAQGPHHIITSGDVEKSGVANMQRTMRLRGMAKISELYSERVSKSSRNRIKEEVKINKATLMMLIIKKLMDEKKRKNYLLNTGYIGEAKTPAWSRNEGKDLKKGGLNRKGIASYRREHPGSKLSMAVTTEPSKLKKGSKSWNRRKSFCSRMTGIVGPMKDEKGRPTRKALSLRKWNC